MRIRRTHLWILAGVVALAAVVYLVLRPEPVPVQIGVVDRGPLRVTIDEDGETRVRDRYVVSAPVTGRMERMTCEVGDSMAAGEVVARIYPLPLDTRERSEAFGRVQSAEAAQRAAEARAARAETARNESRRLLRRLEQVEAEAPGALAAQRLDDARAAARPPALTLEEARRAAESAAHQVETARAALLGAEGATSAQPTLVRAPVSGRVLRVFEECERAVTAGSPLVELGDPADLEVVVDVLTEDAARLREGAPAYVSAGPETDTLAGAILRIEPSAFTRVSPLGVEEQRVNVIAGFDPVPGLGDRFRVDASLVAWQADDVVRVPVSALFRSGDGWGVFVVEDGAARLRRIELGHRGRQTAEVRSGVSPGERVVLYPSEEVEDGARVRIGEESP